MCPRCLIQGAFDNSLSEEEPECRPSIQQRWKPLMTISIVIEPFVPRPLHRRLEDSASCSLLVPQHENRAVAFDSDLGPELLGCIRQP